MKLQALGIFLIASLLPHCGSDSNDGGTNAPSTWTLAERRQLEGFAVYMQDVRTEDRTFFGSLRIQNYADQADEQHVRIFDADGKSLRDSQYPFDLVSARISEPANGVLHFTEAAEVINELRTKVRIRRMSLADGISNEIARLPEPMLNLPLGSALHRERDGRLWCLGVNADFVLTLYGLAEGGASTKTAIATRIVMDLDSKIVGLPDGFLVVTPSKGVDPRFGVPEPAKDAEQIAVLRFDTSGTFVRAETTAFPVRAELGAVHADARRLIVAGTLLHAQNDQSLFVQSWQFSSEGGLVPETTRTFDIGENQVRISALASPPDGAGLLVGGEVGTHQAETGSILLGSRAFLATLSEAPAFALRDQSTFGTPERRNLITTFVSAPGGEGGHAYAFGYHDFPKTHDADGRPDQAYSRTVLYEVVPR